MFDINDAILRFNNEEKFFVGYWDNNIFGYCWLKKLDTNSYHIYNVFSKHTGTKREYGATDMLYYVIKNNTTGEILANIDDWNEKSINVFNKLGFARY